MRKNSFIIILFVLFIVSGCEQQVQDDNNILKVEIDVLRGEVSELKVKVEDLESRLSDIEH